ncbi:hypothetical protein [Cyclobacterium jeungdonense]|uniref:Uncharacterized protein n=1 Tax=Cyclobacterium jeungdonense TaxID=708087 RepID=A0ABT8CA32_9BACT|nr:hypothetical protein [Cyclobacterium jeungdonense]MDN3689002.1 hypothetical protein [Cyclobacterium jeungdonense]
MIDPEASGPESIQSGAADLQKLLQLPAIPEARDRESLAAAIAPTVSRLLNGQLDKLLQLCYRLDLDEQKLRSILSECPPEEMTRRLSLAIVDRQLIKVHYRNKYR